MNVPEILEKEWRVCLARLQRSEFFRRLATGRLGVAHYKSYLRETFHNTAQNPKNMALFMAHLNSGIRPLEAKFLKHAAMEVGHDELTLDDLRALGEDPEPVRSGRPLPTTEAMAAFIVFQIEHRNPLAYLGYLYHLEALPVQSAGDVMTALMGMGVPMAATSFLREHAEADPIHLRWNKEYLQGFVRDEKDLEAAIYGMRGTCELHAVMLQGILDACENAAETAGAETAGAETAGAETAGAETAESELAGSETAALAPKVAVTP